MIKSQVIFNDSITLWPPAGGSTTTKPTITLPVELRGKTINSVVFTHPITTTSNLADKKIYYTDTQKTIDNGNLADRFNNGQYEFKITFYAKAKSGASGKCTWSPVQLEVFYESNDITGKVINEITINENEKVVYGLSSYSAAPNELIFFNAALEHSTKEISSIKIGWKRNDQFIYINANNLKNDNGLYSCYFSFALNFYWNMGTYENAFIQFEFSDSSSTSVVAVINSSNNVPFRFIRSRGEPNIIFLNVLQESEDILYIPSIPEYNENIILFTVAVSSEASDTALQSITCEYRGQIYTIDSSHFSDEHFSFTLPAANENGSIATIKVKDSYNVETEKNVLIRVYQYTPPTLNLELARMTSAEGIWSINDDSTTVGITGEITWQKKINTTEQENDNTLLLSIEVITEDTSFDAEFDPINLSSADAFIEYTSANPNIDILKYKCSNLEQKNEYDTNYNYEFDITLQDNYTINKQHFLVNKSTPGYLNIEKTGVAVGIRSTGSAQNKKFECNYPAYFYQDIYQNSSPLINQITLNNQLNNFFSIQNYIVDGNTVYYLKLGNFLMAFGQASASSSSSDGQFSTIFKKNNSSIFSSVPCMYGTWISTTSTFNSGALGSLQFYNISQDGFYVIAGGNVPAQNNAKPINWIAIGSAASNI